MAARPVLLFVDDEEPVLDALKRSLAGEPYECLFASTFDAALKHLEGRRVDVVVCDERFPGRSGWELLAEIRRVYPRIMRIMLTGAASMASAVAGINHGQVFRLLLKPCPHDTLVEAIRAALEHQALKDQLRRALVCLARVNRLVENVAVAEPQLYQDALRGASVEKGSEAATAAVLGSELEAGLEGVKATLGAP